MPNLLDTDVGTNYRRAFAPFTRFNTRKLAFYEIDLDGLAPDTLEDEELDISSYENPYFSPTHENEYTHNGNFQKAIQVIETRAEIHGVFRPSGNVFMVMVAEDTANVGSTNTPENSDGNPGNYNDNSKSIEEALSDAFDGMDVYVNQRRIKGDQFNYTDLNGLEVADKAQAKLNKFSRK